MPTWWPTLEVASRVDRGSIAAFGVTLVSKTFRGCRCWTSCATVEWTRQLCVGGPQAGATRAACDWLSVKNDKLRGGCKVLKRQSGAKPQATNPYLRGTNPAPADWLRFRREMREGSRKKTAPRPGPPQQTLWTGPAKTGKFSFVSMWPFASVLLLAVDCCCWKRSCYVLYVSKENDAC